MVLPPGLFSCAHDVIKRLDPINPQGPINQAFYKKYTIKKSLVLKWAFIARHTFNHELLLDFYIFLLQIQSVLVLLGDIVDDFRLLMECSICSCVFL